MGTWDDVFAECEKMIIQPLISKGEKKGLNISLTTNCENIYDYIRRSSSEKPNGLLPIAEDNKNHFYHLHVQYEYSKDYKECKKKWVIQQDGFVFMVIEP